MTDLTQLENSTTQITIQYLLNVNKTLKQFQFYRMTTRHHQESTDPATEETAQRRGYGKWLKGLPSDGETGASSLATIKIAKARVVTETPIYVCEVCRSFFPKLRLVNDHISDVHGQYQARCLECRRQFNSKVALDQHQEEEDHKGLRFLEEGPLDLAKLAVRYR